MPVDMYVKKVRTFSSIYNLQLLLLLLDIVLFDNINYFFSK